MGKLDPNWEGPYVVRKVLREGAYELTDVKETPYCSRGTSSVLENTSLKI